jgi:hypothetical protein
MNEAETLIDAIKVLADLKRNDPVIQRGRSGELHRAFKIFWDSNPDEPTFSRVTDGLLFTHQMIYHMVEHPVWLKKEEPVPAVQISPPVPAPIPAPVEQKVGNFQQSNQQKGGKRR